MLIEIKKEFSQDSAGNVSRRRINILSHSVSLPPDDTRVLELIK